jgi:hypothetical protein
MTDAQKKWMSDHPKFKFWQPHGVMSLYGWTDVGFLMPDGKLVPDGEHHNWAWPMHLMSSGGTLYVMPKEATKVGREFMNFT